MSKRRKIPKIVKDMVWTRQKGGCACCIERGREYHHVNPVALGGSNDYPNIVLLCREHHKLLHLGDLETVTQVLEYVYYLKNGDLPTEHHEIEVLAREICEHSQKTSVTHTE